MMSGSRTRIDHPLISQHQIHHHNDSYSALNTRNSSTESTASAAGNNNNVLSQRLAAMTGSVSRITELRNRVQSSHQSYLYMDDNLEKLQFKSKLEALIFELVSVVPHSQKFTNVEVAHCFNQTVVEKDQFSPIQASQAFEKVEKYAENLLRHPWRQEYRVIHGYSGFYRHMVSNCLVAVLPVIHAMGYRERDPEHPGQFILEEMIDRQRLTSISLDCLIAFVELRIMHQMRETLKSKDLNVSYSEIFATRLRHISGMDQAVKIIAESRTQTPNHRLRVFTSYVV